MEKKAALEYVQPMGILLYTLCRSFYSLVTWLFVVQCGRQIFFYYSYGQLLNEFTQFFNQILFIWLNCSTINGLKIQKLSSLRMTRITVQSAIFFEYQKLNELQHRLEFLKYHSTWSGKKFRGILWFLCEKWTGVVAEWSKNYDEIYNKNKSSQLLFYCTNPQSFKSFSNKC